MADPEGFQPPTYRSVGVRGLSIDDSVPLHRSVQSGWPVHHCPGLCIVCVSKSLAADRSQLGRVRDRWKSDGRDRPVVRGSTATCSWVR